MRRGYETADCANYKLLKELAIHHRAHPTDAESLIWSMLSGKSLGVRFRQQHIIGNYIVDFVCLSKRLIVEIDGGYHTIPTQIEDDIKRTNKFETLGFRVIRFTNEEVIGDTENVIKKIKKIIDEQ